MPTPRKSFAMGCLAGIFLGVVLSVAGAYGLAFAFKDRIAAFASKQLLPPPITLNQTADYNWTVQSMTGQEFDLRTLQGKPVFLHLWSADCIPCRSEIESINNLYAQFADKGVAFACIARAGIEEVPDVIAQYGMRAPVYTFEGARPAPFNDDSVPATYIVASDGRVVFKHLGAAKWDDVGVAGLLTQLIGR